MARSPSAFDSAFEIGEVTGRLWGANESDRHANTRVSTRPDRREFRATPAQIAAHRLPARVRDVPVASRLFCDTESSLRCCLSGQPNSRLTEWVSVGTRT